MRIRTRSVVRGPSSGLGNGGGTVTLRVDLSRHPALPEHAPLSIYRIEKGVRVRGHGQPMRVLRNIVAQSARNSDEFSPHPLRIGSSPVLAAGGDVSERAIRGEGRWKSDVYKVCTRNDEEGARQISRKLLVVAGKGQRQPGQGTIWGKS